MAKLKASPLEKLSDDELLAQLRDVATALALVNDARSDLYERRVSLWREGRRRVPPIWTEHLGDASGVKDSLVSATLNKADQ